MTKQRYDAQALREFSQALLQAAGMDAPAAEAVADTLVGGDLLGHDTHGLALLAPYIKEIETKSMEVSCTAKTLSDRGAALLWDGRRLHGHWLIRQGIDTLTSRARDVGKATPVIQNGRASGRERGGQE